MDWYYKRYGRDIVSRYRRRALERFGREFFSEANNYGTPMAVQGPGAKRPEGLPIFWEFVQFVIDTP